MDYLRQTLTYTVLSIVLMLVGSMGYMVIEGWNFMDSFYMTVITLATVGYGEVNQVSFEGRIFTVALILMGVGYFVFVAGNIIQFLVEGQIRLVLGRRKLDTQINKLKGHYIICGYGRIGRVLARFLIARYINVVVIERNQNRAAIMDEEGVLYLIGDAKDELVLEMAFADDSVDIQIEEIRVKANSKMAGISLKGSKISENFDLMIIGIRKPDDTMVFHPKGDTTFEADDTMVVVGSAKNIQRIERVL